MINEKIYEAISKLNEKKSQIRREINRPTKWIKDPVYKAVCQKIKELEKKCT